MAAGVPTKDIGAIEVEITRGHKRKVRTRQKLLEAALRLYARKKAGILTLAELAEEAGVSNGTVYNYFRTQDEVLQAVAILLAENCSHHIGKLCVGITCGAERLSIGIRSFIIMAMENTEWAGAMVKVARYADGMESALASYVRSDLQAGNLQGDFQYGSEDIALALVVSTTVGAMASIVDGHTLKSHDSIVAEMILLALGANKRKVHHLSRLPMPIAEVGDTDKTSCVD